MKAVVLSSNKKIELLNVSKPQIESDECLIAIKYVGICSSDIYRAFDSGAYFYPLIMGHEFAGEVIEIGSGVSEFKIGDKVAVFPLKPCFSCDSCSKKLYAQCVKYSYYGSRCNGAFSEFLNVNKWNLIKIPDSISLKDACLIEPLAVVLHGINKLNLFECKISKPKVAILGSGFLGIMLIDLLKLYKPTIEITIIDRNQFKLEIVKSEKVKTELLQSDIEWDNFLLNNN